MLRIRKEPKEAGAGPDLAGQSQEVELLYDQNAYRAGATAITIALVASGYIVISGATAQPASGESAAPHPRTTS